MKLSNSYSENAFYWNCYMNTITDNILNGTAELAVFNFLTNN